jgi:hypothetical protein
MHLEKYVFSCTFATLFIKMRSIMKKTGLLYFFIFFRGLLFAQDAGVRQTIDRSAVEYLKMVNEESVLYYGNLQEELPRTTNHSFLQDAQYAKARLSYLGVIYPEVMLRLDLWRDELVIYSPDNRNVVLFPENVDDAELYDKRIIYLQPDNLPGSPSQGYYYQLHSGNCTVLEKQTASLNRKENMGRWEEYYIISTKFYLLKDGAYQTIRTKRGLLQALQPYKKELKRFISANHLSFRKNQEEFLVQTVSEYEKLSGLQ